MAVMTMSQVPEQPSVIGDIMSRDVHTVRLRDKVSSVLSLFESEDITGAPVVDDDGRLVGVVTSYDMIVAAGVGKQGLSLGELPPAMAVKKEVVTIAPDAPIKDAMVQMIKRRVGRIIVVDAQGRLCGVLGRSDLVKYIVQNL